MPKNETAASGVGARHGGSTQKITRTLNHAAPAAASAFVAVFDGGRFVGLRRFEHRAAARAAQRQGVLG